MTLADIIASAAVALSIGAPVSHPQADQSPILDSMATYGGSESTTKPEDMKVTLNMVDGKVADILSVLSMQTHLDLVLMVPSDKKLTLHVNDKKLIDVVKLVSASADIGYLRIGSMYILAPEENLKAKYPKEYAQQHPESVPVPAAQIDTPRQAIEVVRLSYVSAQQVAQTLVGVYGANGPSLTITAGPVQASPQLTGVTSGMTSSSGSSGGSGGSSGASGGAGASGATPTANNPNNGHLLVLRGDPAVVAEAAKLARQLDTERPQVTIAVTIYDISNDALKNLGLDWSFSNLSITEGTPNKLNFGSFSRAPLSFTAAITALETKNQAKTLANPTISLLDGEQASILSGDRISFPVVVGYSQANTPIFDKQEERVGIYLVVAASVSADDNITISLAPQVSTITGFLSTSLGSYPQISTREAQTTVRIRSGDTIVMGGLLKSEETNEMSRVPLLGQVPLLGELFTRRKKTKNASQVIISIRPIVIRSHEPR